MAYENLKNSIKQTIKQNSNQEITGNLLQSTLLSIIDNVTKGYKLVGIADTHTDPGIPDDNVYYIATANGTYVNFGINIQEPGYLSLIMYSSLEKKWTLKVITRIDKRQYDSCMFFDVEKYDDTYILMPAYLKNEGILIPSIVLDVSRIFARKDNLKEFKLVNITNIADVPAVIATNAEGDVIKVIYNKDRSTELDINCNDFSKNCTYFLINCATTYNFYVVHRTEASDDTQIITYDDPTTRIPWLSYLRNQNLSYDTYFNFLAEEPLFVSSNRLGDSIISTDLFKIGIIINSDKSNIGQTLHVRNAISKKDFPAFNIPSIVFFDGDFNVVDTYYSDTRNFDYDINSASFNRKIVYGCVTSFKNSVRPRVWFDYMNDSKYLDKNKMNNFSFNTSIGVSGALLNFLYKHVKSFTGKRCTIFGDSITWLGNDDCTGTRGWTKYLKDNSNFVSIKSYARSGATWTNTAKTVYDIQENTSNTSDNNNIFNQINRYINAIENGEDKLSNYILIALGTNDALFRYSQSISDYDKIDNIFTEQNFENNVAINTCLSLVKSIKYIADMIFNHFPEAKVVVLTPLQSASIDFYKISKCGDIIEAAAHRCSWNVIRQDKECGISFMQEKRNYVNTYDGIHTSDKGAKKIGNYIYKRLCGMLL